MPKTVTVSYACDACGAELSADAVLIAQLPLHRGDSPRLRRGEEGNLEPPAWEGVFCSWACLQADVNERAAA